MIKEATRRGLEADNNEASIDSLEAFCDDMRGTEKPFWADPFPSSLTKLGYRSTIIVVESNCG
jgi:hypothetical protein